MWLLHLGTILLPFRDLHTSPVWLLSVYGLGRHCLIVSDSYLWSVWLSGASVEFVWLLSGSGSLLEVLEVVLCLFGLSYSLPSL